MKVYFQAKIGFNNKLKYQEVKVNVVYFMTYGENTRKTSAIKCYRK